MSRGAGAGPTRRYVVPPQDLRALVAEAHERARATVVRELVEELLPVYREALAEHFGPSLEAADKEAAPGRDRACGPVPGGGSTDRPASEEPLATRQPPVPPAAAERAWYVYAVARAEDATRLDVLTGIDDEPVHVVRAGGLAALASELEMAGFHAAEREPELSEDGWLAHALRAHDAVVAQAFATVPVLPLRFGSLYPQRDTVVEMLQSRAEGLAAEVDRLAPAAEWHVKAYVGAVGTEVSVPAEPGGGEVDGTAWMRQRRDAAVARETARAERSRLAAEVGKQLAEHARDTYLRPEPTRPDPAAPALDAVYLVDHVDQERFLAVVDRLRERYSDDVLRLAVVGPQPAYHFVRLDPAESRHG